MEIILAMCHAALFCIMTFFGVASCVRFAQAVTKRAFHQFSSYLFASAVYGTVSVIVYVVFFL